MLTNQSPNLLGSAPSYNQSQLRYPETSFDSDTDYVKINFYDYVAPFSSQSGSGVTNNTGQGFSAYNSSSSTSALGSPTSTMHLYMPEDIEGEYGGNWNITNLSTVARGALGGFGKAATGDIGGSFGTGIDTAKTLLENSLSKGTAAVNAISDLLSKTNFGSLTVNDIFAGATGQVLNPNTEVLYNGPSMRTFSLNFKMAPRNSTEADNIKKIIHVFKYATLPKYGGSNGSGQPDPNAASFVRVPQIVDVTFMKGNTENPWVNQYKPAVISNFSVSYTPDGAWATLPNGSPVATTMKISFQETKMIYANELSSTGATY